MARPSRKRASSSDSTEQANVSRWWRETGNVLASSLWSWIDKLKPHQRAQNAMDAIHEAIYLMMPVGTRSDNMTIEFLRRQRAAQADLPIAQSLVDTVVARLGKRRPMPVIGADDAKYSEKLYARRASRVLRRKLGKPNVERMCPLVLRDAIIRGTGVARVYRSGGDVHTERIPRYEIIVDQLEARRGKTRTLARVRLEDRDALMAQFPKFKDQIARVQRGTRDEWAPYEYESSSDPDMIEVAEAWRLPTSPTAEDGKYVYTVRGINEPLVERAWCRPRFPMAFVHWIPPIRDFWGIGLMQQIAGMQGKVNETHRSIQEDIYWGGSMKILTPRSGNVVKTHLRARHPAIVEYDGGGKPEVVPGNPMSRDTMEYLRWVIQQMYEISGISQASAQSKNPLGPNASGKALDTMYDLESDRFSHVEMQYAMWKVDLGQGVLDEAQDAAEYEDELPDGIKLASWIDEIDWAKFDVDGGNYHLNLEPVNFLPEARAGKLDTVQDMAKIPGLFSNPLQMAALFDEPDIARANRHILGPFRCLEKVMEKLADLDVPLEDCTPTPYMMKPAGLAQEMCEGELGNAYAEDADDETLGRYRWFLKMLEGLSKQASGPSPMMGAGAPPAGPAPMPGAGPGPLPPMPGNGMGGLDAMAAAGMAPQGMAA